MADPNHIGIAASYYVFMKNEQCGQSSRPTKKDEVSFFVIRSSFCYFSPMFPGLFKSPSFVLIQLSPLALQPPASFSILVSLLCEELQWFADATLTRSDAITGSSSSCMDVAQWQTRMTYCRCKPNAGSVVTDTLTWICCGSKVTAPSVKQPHIYYNTYDMTFSLQSALIKLQAPYRKIQTRAGDSEKTLHLHFNL